MAPRCPHCGKTVFNKRYPKCEFCGSVLPEGLALTAEQRKHVLEQERAASDAAWLAKNARSSKSDDAAAGLVFLPLEGLELGPHHGSAGGGGDTGA